MKKFISFTLAIIILFSIIPAPSFAKGQVMEIDALFGNFKLYLENRPISHKEVFIYDGELWVPMKELSNALGIKYDFNSNKRNLSLNSYNKLNIRDTSLEPVAYQSGYEIQAMKRRIAEIENEIREFEGRKTDSTPELQGTFRNIKVSFSDINVFLDGKKIDLDRDPLIYNNDVYISLVSLSPILYITPEFNGNIINIDGNAILVNKPKPSGGYYNVAGLTVERNAEINEKLNRKLARLEKERKVLKDIGIPYEDIKNLKDMEWYLNKYLDYIDELPVSIDLRAGSNSWYYINVEFRSNHINRWRKLSRRDVEAYIWDIFVAITNLYDEDAKIQGQIRSSSSTRYNYVEFNTYMNNIEFKFIDSGLDIGEKIDPIYIEDLLRKELDKYNGIRFDYSAKLSGYDLELAVYPNSRDFMDKWPIYTKLDYLEEMNHIIKKYYPQLKINGNIEYPSRESIEFLIENGKIRSAALERETEEFLNNRYGVFSSSGIRIPMKYKLQALNFNDYKLLVDMDFDINNSKWNKTMEDELGAFLQDVISEIIALWDINVFVEAYDRNQYLVKEVVIAQDIVQMVNAVPVSGEIVEGSTITLYTNTPGANIYYTLDGSFPYAGNRISYTGPIVINKDTTIRAYATKTGMKDSPVSTFEYKVVDDKNIASGLENLIVEGGKLEPSFDKKVFDYTVNVNYPIESINIIATTTSGNIEINGQIVESGKAKNVKLEVGENKIKIAHKEDGKKDRIYTIVITRSEEGKSDVKLAPGYTFETSVMGIFRGRLTSSSIKTFNGYSVRLLSGADKVYKKVEVNSDGSFEIIGFDIGLVEKIMGYKYEIIDPNGQIIGGEDL